MISRLLAALTFGPMLLWLVSIGAVLFLGSVMGCTIHEGYANPCMVVGFDLGNMASSMGIFAAWGPLFFGPVVLGAGFLWFLMALIRQLRKRKP